MSPFDEPRIRTWAVPQALASRLNARWQTEWAIMGQMKTNMNPIARPHATVMAPMRYVINNNRYSYHQNMMAKTAWEGEESLITAPSL